MSEKILITPVTRTEGHGTIIIDTKDGKVSDVRFQVKDFRGFERFLVGSPVERLPVLTSRVCGICYTAHSLCSAKAIENAWGIKISPIVEKLRRLLLMGQFIESEVLSLAILSLPDMLFPRGKATERNIAHLLKTKPDMVKEVIKLRNAGSKITKLVGGREVHPCSPTIGGMIHVLKKEDLAEMKKALAEGEKGLKVLTETILNLLKTDEGKAFFTRAPLETAFLALSNNGKLDFYDGKVTVIDSSGAKKDEFTAEKYFEKVKEDEKDYSYMKFPILADGTFIRVGPLARVNIAGKMPTPRADEFLNQVKEVIPLPIKSTTGYHLARLAELIYSWEEAGNLVNDAELTSPEVRPKPIKPKAGEGYGIIEAPRGTLVHNYKINAEGFAEKVTLLVATQQNNYAINQSLFYEGKDLTPESSKDEIALNRLEMLLRSYDPCLSCSTHALGDEGIKVIWRDREGRG